MIKNAVFCPSHTNEWWGLMSTYLHNQDVLHKKQERSVSINRKLVTFQSHVWVCLSQSVFTYNAKFTFVKHWLTNSVVWITPTLPVSVDRSSPPMTLISPVDWSFCERTRNKAKYFVLSCSISYKVSSHLRLLDELWWLNWFNPVLFCFFLKKPTGLFSE